MLLAAAVAIWKGWQLHRGETAILAYGLGVMALLVGIWHLTRTDPRSLPQPSPADARGAATGNPPGKKGL